MKGLFHSAGVTFKAFELDEIGEHAEQAARLSCRPHIKRRRAEEGEDILDTLVGMTGSRTVPQVFVKSEYIGGCDGEMHLPWRSKTCSKSLALDRSTACADTMAKQRQGQLAQILEKAGIKFKL